MKKVILRTVVSLFVFIGFVAGPWGLDLVGTGTAVAQNCDSPAVEACIFIKPNGKVKLKAGPGKQLRPRTGDNGPLGPTEKTKKTKPADDAIPPEIISEVTLDANGEYTKHDITIYGDNTCMVWGGIWYCW